MDGEFRKKLLDDFIRFLNENPEEVTVYINSMGGAFYVYKALEDAISQNKDRITLVATGEICSSAFLLFFSVKCNRRILDGTTGLHHLSGLASVRVSAGNKIHDKYLKFVLDTLSPEKELEWCRNAGLNEEEISIIASGEDAYFTEERLRELLASTS